MSVKNAKTMPKRYFGLHMVEGVAEYKDPAVNDGKPYRIFIGEETLKKMDATYEGHPVYVRHVDEVKLETIQTDADGYVVRSFFNQADGKHWVEFMCVSDAAHDAIQKGWRLSNSYVPKEISAGGLWHGVQYEQEIKSGVYDHLAIVPDPRYDESIVLTPEQFKQYNSDKELELKKFANSKGEKSMFNFFKKTPVENSADFEGMSVVLPKSKREVVLSKLINEADMSEMADCYANGEHKVKVGDEEMTVNELVSKHMELKKMNKEAEVDVDAHKAEEKGEGELKVNDEDKAKAEAEVAKLKADDAKKKNDDAAGDEKKLDDKKKNSIDYFDALKNAPSHAIKEEQTIDLGMDKVARGKTRYGSN